MSAWTSPGRTDSDADLSATTAPYVLAMPSASSRRSVPVTVMGFPDSGGDAGEADVPAGST
jgi:hypothetical protein